MAWKSGATTYLVRETPEQIVAGIRERLATKGLRLIEIQTRRGVRLRLDAAGSDERGALPAFEIGEVELRFAARDETCEVRVRSRRRRRWWTLAAVAVAGFGTLIVDLVVAGGFLTLELGRAANRSQHRQRKEDPRLLHAVAGFLGPRDVGQIEAAPFRRSLPK